MEVTSLPNQAMQRSANGVLTFLNSRLLALHSRELMTSRTNQNACLRIVSDTVAQIRSVRRILLGFGDPEIPNPKDHIFNIQKCPANLLVNDFSNRQTNGGKLDKQLGHNHAMRRLDGGQRFLKLMSFATAR